MAQCSQKSHISFKLLLVLILLFIILAAVILLNIIVASSQTRLTEAAGRYFTQKISIKRIFYLPPNFIILKDVSIKEAPPKNKQLFSIPVITAEFSLSELLFRKQLYISQARFFYPRSDYGEFSLFLKDNFSRILSFISHLPKQNFRLFVKGARIDSGPSNTPAGARYLALDLLLTFKDNILSGAGAVSDNSKSRGIPLNYGFKGQLTRTGVAIEKLEFTRGNLYSQFWGSTDGGILELKGFTFINTNFKEYEYREPAQNILERIKFNMESPSDTPGSAALPRANLYILDIDCRFNFKLPELEIERLSFSLNNHPMSLKGKISFSEPLVLDLSLSAYLAPLGEIQVENLKKIELSLKGAVEKNIFKGNGMLNLDFVKKKIGNPPLQKAEIGLGGLYFDFDKFPRLDLGVNDLSLFFRTDSNEYRIFFKDFSARCYSHGDRFKYLEYSSLFYDGSLKGKARLDVIKLPPKIVSVARVREVSANKLAGIMVHFSKVYGKLFSVMSFNNYPHMDLEGRMYIQKGYLKNFEFFKWLADFFDLPSLKMVDFNKVTSNFSVNGEGASLHEINLDSQGVGAGGNFSLGANDAVAGRLSLSFTKGFLQGSPKFTRLLALAGTDLNLFGFDFQLSGNLHKMNFLWLASDFKRKLESSIPNFIERKIEKNIEDAIESISVK